MSRYPLTLVYWLVLNLQIGLVMLCVVSAVPLLVVALKFLTCLKWLKTKNTLWYQLI